MLGLLIMYYLILSDYLSHFKVFLLFCVLKGVSSFLDTLHIRLKVVYADNNITDRLLYDLLRGDGAAGA